MTHVRLTGINGRLFSNLSGKIKNVETVYFITICLLLIVCCGVIAFLVYRIYSLRAEKQRLVQSLGMYDLSREKLEQQLNFILQLTHDFTEARDERQIIETLISKSMELSGAIGGSFVPLDDNGQPQAAIRKGEFPFSIPDAWLEYLATPAVREKCQNCANHKAFDQHCPLLQGPFSDILGLFCFPLRYGERELGVLNIYLSDTTRLDRDVQSFIQSIAEATALALEGERLRQREITTLSQVNQVRQKQDLEPAIIASLDNLQNALNAEFSTFILDIAEEASFANQLKSKKAFAIGNLTTENFFKIENFLEQHRQRCQETVFSKIEVTQSGLSWLGILIPYENHGKRSWLILAAAQPDSFSQRRILLAQSIADKLVFLIQNTDSLAGIEYRILMEERTRLAREIHDGLAQTLGFLKLQIAQMIGHLDRNDMDRLRASMRTCYDTLAVAYQDVRLAIDGLRVSPHGEGGYKLGNWLAQIAEEYTEQPFELRIHFEENLQDLPPEIHAQLIRIVQEALSNIRKHAQASLVWIACTQKNNDFFLEIRDDGIGFTPEDVPKPSRYGLKGMRERSELVGADFQIISRPGEGTTIRVRIPLEEQDWMEV
jgi:two-component system, NarL family, nitrate/nitrite sensor histidine kinase NarX